MGEAAKYVAFLLSFILLAGCFSTDDERIDGEKQRGNRAATSDDQESEMVKPKEDERSSLKFEWSPPEDVKDHVYLFNVTAGPDTECYYGSKAEGDSYSTSSHLYSRGIGFTKSLEDVWLRSAVHRIDHSTMQYEVISSKPVMDAVREVSRNVLVQTWGSGSEFRVADGNSSGFVRLSMGSVYHEEILPTFRVECDGDNALIRFWLADDFEPIHTNSVEADMAVNLNVPPEIRFSHVENGRYQINTEGELILFDVGQSPEEGVLNPYVEGDFLLKTPSGEEAVAYNGEERSVFQRVWREPGEYEVVLNRHAEGFDDLLGVLAGFRLEAELGDLQDEGVANGP